MSEQTAWLIERRKSPSLDAGWWTGAIPGRVGHWSTNANEAVRFARKADAERVIATVEMLCQPFASEHVWMDMPAISPSDAQIGQSVLDAIMAGGLLRTECPTCAHHGLLHVWSGNAQDQLGAAARSALAPPPAPAATENEPRD